MTGRTPGADTNARPWSWPPAWWRRWRRTDLRGDLTAGVVVAVMLVPQSMAYATLAGLPVQAGLLASVLPLLAYAVFGDSRTLSVGPAAITSLMVGHALASLAVPGSAPYLVLSAVLAAASGLLMLMLGVLRMGFLSQLLSRPVVQGFTVASAMLISMGQLGPLLGGAGLGHTLPDMVHAVAKSWSGGGSGVGGRGALGWAWADAGIGLGSLLALWLGPRLIRGLTTRRGRDDLGLLASRLWPLVVLAGAAGLAWYAHHHGASAPQVVGALRMDGMGQVWSGAAEHLDWSVARALVLPVLMVSLIGFVSSMSVAQAFAFKHGDRVDADRELLGLGLANLGGAVLGGLAVAGGLSRTVVNEAAGARSPLAGVITSMLLLVLIAVLLPVLAWLPKASLAAIIIMAVLNLVSFKPWTQAWAYDRAEAGAFASTLLGVLMLGFEVGLLVGLVWSLAALVWRHSQPHMAEVGRVPGTEHFRNVDRHRVECLPGVLMVRVDESLAFTNIHRVEQGIGELLAHRPGTRALVLIMGAVNHIDQTALHALEELQKGLQQQGVSLYLTDIKGPVMDRLQPTPWMQRMRAQVFLSAQQAWESLSRSGSTGLASIPQE